MNLFEVLAALESNDDLHLARLLILLYTFAKKDNTGSIEGLTKLAKLDFLLRYPVYLERALEAKARSTKNVQIADHERKSVESSMVRYKYGPWDFRYRRFINMLVGMGLVGIEAKGRTIEIKLTDTGLATATKLVNEDAFDDIVRRSNILKTHFNVTGTNLMKFIYSTFPEIGSLSLGEKISS